MEDLSKWNEARHIETANNDGRCPTCAMPERDCECEPPEFKAFEFNGTTITNPYISECGRFEVDPFTYYGLTDADRINGAQSK